MNSSRGSIGRLALTATFASMVLLFAPSAFAADDPPGSEQAPSLTPQYPNERPSWAKDPNAPPEISPNASRTSGWYGLQIIVPTATFDVLAFIGLPLFASSHANIGQGLILTSIIGRSLSGPIVHLGHGHGLRALASFGLESSGIVVGVATAAITLKVCDDLLADYIDYTDKKCNGNAAYGVMIGVPLAAAITGTIIDSVFVSREKPEVSPKIARMPFSVSPYVLPSFHRDEPTGMQRLSLQMGFAGQF